jgi:hypothetical protein
MEITMKKINLATIGLLFISGITFADLLPRPGTVSRVEITGLAAQILNDSLTEEETQLPTELTMKSECGEGEVVSSGKIHVTRLSASQSTTIVCASYYCRGRHSVCLLQRKY